MASEVDICNLMLSRLGDDATVSSLNPPEGSAQAEHCAMFYPIARDSLLELHDWGFATRRVALAETALPSNAGWLYAFLVPSDCIKIIAVLPPDAADNYTATLGNIPGYRDYGSSQYDTNNLRSFYMPQDFQLESDDNGNAIILTNQPSATARFLIRVTDTTKFSPLFVDVLGWYGAHMLAGPLIKGDVGAAESKRCLQIAMNLMSKATASDAQQQQVRPQQNVPWIGGR